MQAKTEGWKWLGAAVAGALALAACGDAPTRPEPEPPELELEARVNVQLGDTPVGARPFYIVTGYAAAVVAGRARAAHIDSVVVEYARNTEAWVRVRRTSQIPFSGDLPFEAASGDVYRLIARLYASAADGAGERQVLMAEWSASGAAFTP